MNIPIFVGYDQREAVAYSVFCHSVLACTDEQVSFTPVRGLRRDGSTGFTYSRFLVPWMCDYKGWALWCDGDMLCRADIADLWALRQSGYDVMVAQHDYKTKYPVKFLGQRNEDYPRKNWSSLMLIDCANAAWRRLTPETVAKMSGAELHRFAFLKDKRIGEIPLEWNWLVGEYDYSHDAKLAHFTIGTPCWPEYADCDYAQEWRDERVSMLSYASNAERQIA